MARSASLTALISVIDKVSKPMKKIVKAMREPIAAANKMGGAFAGVGQQVGALIAPLGLSVGGIAAGVGLAGRSVVQTSAQFERFETILSQLEGSSEAGRKSMAWVQKFAEKTPYELAQVTEAFVAMKSYGIDPMDGSLQMLGDAAAATGKPLSQMVEALADARMGQFERLAEAFAIKGGTEGNDAVFSYTDKLGKQMAIRATKNDPRAIQAAIMKALEGKGVGGSMDKLSQTWDGMWSNMMDTFARVQLTIGESGFFPFMKEQLGGFIGTLNTMTENGQIKVWAQQVSDSLIAIVKPMAQFLLGYEKVVDEFGTTARVPGFFEKLPEYIRGLADMIGTIREIVSAIGGWKTVAVGIGAVLAGPLLLAVWQLGSAAWGLGSTLWPLALKAFPLVGAAAGKVAGVLSSGLLKVLALVAQGAYSVLVALGGAFVKGLALAAGAVKALGAAFMALPTGWIIAAVAAVAFAVYAIYENWDQITAWFWAKFEAVKAAFDEGFVNGIMTALAEFNPLTILMETINGLISWLFGVDLFSIGSEWFGKLGDGIMQAVAGIGEKLRAGLDSVLSVLPDELRDMVGLGAEDMAAPSPADRQAALSGGGAAVTGGMTVRFENAPPGMRVDGGQSSQRGFDINADVGYRNMAIGGP